MLSSLLVATFAVHRLTLLRRERRRLRRRAIDRHDLLLRQPDLTSSPLAHRTSQPPLPLVLAFRLPLLLERERLPALSSSALLRPLAEPCSLVPRLRALEVRRVLTTAQEARGVLRQWGVALECLCGFERELAEEIGERGGARAGCEGFDERGEVRVEFREVAADWSVSRRFD